MGVAVLFAVLLLQAPVTEAKTSPVTKIVNMLKDMTTQLMKEQDQDNEMMETMNCWCETYDKEKTAAIKAAEDSIASLKTTSEEQGAAAAKFSEEITSLEAILKKSTESLASATEQRKKALAEFNEEEKDLLASITSVGDAIIQLEKHHSASLLQAGGSASKDTHNVAMMLQAQLRKHDKILHQVISPHQRKVIAALLHTGSSLVQSPEDYFKAVESVGIRLPKSMAKFMPNKQLMQLDEVPGGKYYQSASGEIFGILKQMKESFEENLNSAQVQETADNKAFDDLKTAKTAEIAATESSLGAKEEALGDASFKKAKADQDAEDTQNILEADTKYLMELKKVCATADADFEARRKTRIMETTAVTKALEFLQSDDAQDLFHKTFSAASFIQKSQTSKRAIGAADLLKKAAKKFANPKLSALAVKVRLDAFTKAKEQIQIMIDELKKEQADEVAKKDMCIAEINSNEAQTEAATRDKDEAVEKVDSLEATIDTLTKEIAELKIQVADGQTAMKRAGEDREIENKDFQLTIADQRATQKVLTAALEILKGFYDKAALMATKTKQEPYVAGPPPPTAFKAYEKQGSGGVTGAIQSVIDDAKAMEADAIRAEADAQQGYENFSKDTNDAVDEMIRSINTKTVFKAQCESDKVETEQSRDTSISTLEELANENTALHADCDYTLKNFDLRQSARSQEIEALKQALVFLSGGSFKALLQGDDVTPEMQMSDEVHNHYEDYRQRLKAALD